MRIIIVAVAVFLVFLLPVSALRITEIMPNPEWKDDGREWIEIYNDGEVANISGLRLIENGVNHKTSIINGSDIFLSGGYAIIADNADVFRGEYGYDGVLLDSSFSLSNSGEVLNVSLGNMSDSVNYSGDGASEGRSIELRGDVWAEGSTNGTPGYGYDPDYVPCDHSIDILTEKDVFSVDEKIKYRHIVSDDFGADDNFTVEYWIEDAEGNVLKERYNSTNTDWRSWTPGDDVSAAVLKATVYPACEDMDDEDNHARKVIAIRQHDENFCDASISIDVEKAVYENGEKISYRHILDGYEGDIEYWIEDAWGDIVKEKRMTSNTDEKRFTPKTDEKEKVLLLKARIFPGCESDKSYAERMVVVRNDEYSESENECEQDEKSEMEKRPVKKFEYYFVDMPGSVVQGDEVELSVRMKNNDYFAHEVVVRSYAYRRNVCITDGGNRSVNNRVFMVGPHESVVFGLKNRIDDDALGDYRMKVLFGRDDRVTDQSISMNFTVFERVEEIVVEENDAPVFLGLDDMTVMDAGEVVYESREFLIRENSGNILVVFLMGVSLAVGLFRMR